MHATAINFFILIKNQYIIDIFSDLHVVRLFV